MAFSETLATEIRNYLTSHHVSFTEKKMFGGLSFMVNGNMCVGIIKDEMVIRLDPKDQAAALESPHIRVMDFTGRPMKGWLMVDTDGLKEGALFESSIHKALSYVTLLPAK